MNQTLVASLSLMNLFKMCQNGLSYIETCVVEGKLTSPAEEATLSECFFRNIL